MRLYTGFRDQWRVLLNMAMYLQILWRAGSFLTGRAAISILSLLHGTCNSCIRSTFLKLLDLEPENNGGSCSIYLLSNPNSVCPVLTFGRVHTFTNNVLEAYCLNGWADRSRGVVVGRWGGNVCVAATNISSTVLCSVVLYIEKAGSFNIMESWPVPSISS